MRGYRELRFWSATLDCEAARLSMVDDQGREYFVIVPVERQKVNDPKWRDRREAALCCLDDAISAGIPPGEIGA